MKQYVKGGLIKTSLLYTSTTTYTIRNPVSPLRINFTASKQDQSSHVLANHLKMHNLFVDIEGDVHSAWLKGCRYITRLRDYIFN